MGRLSFTADELAELRQLVTELRRSDGSRQKTIRANIRRIGFYISDVSHDAGGFTVTDFDALVRRGVITQDAADSDGRTRVKPGHGCPNHGEGVTRSSATAIPERWTKHGLEADGFGPWVAFAELESVLTSIPVLAAGVYIVLRDRTADPDWQIPSPVENTWRGDPTVSIEALQANWVPGASVVYIGKAKQRQLRARLRAYLRFGQARGGRHWGGRLVWQLDAPWELRVAWRIEAERDALDVERDLLTAFRIAHNGHPPFANHPDRLGR